MVMTAKIRKHSVREFPTEDSPLPALMSYIMYRGALLPTKGNNRRDRALFDFYWNDHNWLIRGAFANIAKQFASTPSEIKGDQPRLVRYYEDVLSQAEFGSFGGGLRGLMLRFALNYLRFDSGALVEMVGNGNKRGPIRGRVESIAMIDNLRCRFSGIPEYPVDYWPRKGELYRLHETRVAQIVDMPDTTEEWNGAGDCALARAVSVVQQQIVMDRYNIQRMDDLPPAGVMLLNNIKQKWDDAVANYEADRRRDGADIWANVMVMEGIEPDKPAGIDFTSFASVPEHFDYEKYIRIQVNAAALALGVDPQDIWPLSGAALGTGTQSEILHTKGQGKTLADLRTAFTRFINFYVLPDSLEFQFKFKDAEQDKQQADTEAVLVANANALKGVFDAEIAAQYLVNTSDRFADVLLDAAGQLRLPSDDPKPETDTLTIDADAVTTESDTPTTDAPGTPAQETIAESDTPLDDETQKDVQATRLDFEADVSDAISAARSGSIDRRRFGIVMRAHLAKYGRKAFADGLEEGGILEPPDAEDLNTITGMVADQSRYVTDLGSVIYSAGITDAQAVEKATLWWNKSMSPFYQAGIASADKNGLYEWTLGATEQHCKDCLRLNGQKHRMKDWIGSGWQPQADHLECKGFHCDCKLVKSSGRASGRF